MGGKSDNQKTLAEVQCNPCYNSSTGPNPHYDWAGNKGAQPVGSTAAPKAASDKKEGSEANAVGLAQIECNPCPNSAAAPNNNWPASQAAKPAASDEKKEGSEAQTAGLA